MRQIYLMYCYVFTISLIFIGIENERGPKILETDFLGQTGCCSTCNELKKKEYVFEPYQDYIIQKMHYGYVIWHMAEKYDCFELYEEFFNYSIEIARLSVKVTHELKYYLVMALLAMGRYNDAYDMIKFWILKFDGNFKGNIGHPGIFLESA